MSRNIPELDQLPKDASDFIDSVSHGYGGDCYIQSACVKLFHWMTAQITPSPKDQTEGQNLQRSDFEKLVWSLWEKDGKPQLNMHGYLQGAIAMDRHYRRKESAPISQGEIPEEIEEVVAELWEKEILVGSGLAGAYRLGVIACYHKMQEEIKDYKEVLKDKAHHIRRLDVIWNGEEGAAKQAALIDIVGQIEDDLPKMREEIQEYRRAMESVLNDMGSPLWFRTSMKKLLDKYTNS